VNVIIGTAIFGWLIMSSFVVEEQIIEPELFIGFAKKKKMEAA
jgi:hypothetical protein